MVQTDMGGGHDWTAPRFDALGIFYVLFAFFYTCLLGYGLFMLFMLRKTAAVKLRNFWILCPTVLVLHFYLVAILLVYPLNGTFRCGEEFWIMSIVLPLGMALFQASNIRLLAYYEEQQDLADLKSCEKRHRLRWSLASLRLWWKGLDTAQKTYVGIAIGGACQFAVTCFLFFGSRRFHSSYGIFSQHVDASTCRRGLEWIPSVFWQFLWTTVFGPYLLLRIRHIFDTHYWAWQTRLAILACLPGTPLWLAFVYSDNPKLAEINRWFVPAGWFLPGLFMMQFVSVFFPLYDAMKMRHLTKKLGGAFGSSSSSLTPNTTEKNRTYSLASLDYQIENNIEPLLRWSAQKEFTAENIVFIRAVRDFKKKWGVLSKRNGSLTNDQLRERYEEAAVIYFKLVNPLTAKFNINIDHKTYMELQTLFAGLEYEPWPDSDSESYKSSAKSENVVTPWADFESPSDTNPLSPKATSDALSDHALDKLYPLPVTEIRSSDEDSRLRAPSDTSHTPFHIPPSFNVDVFDKAYDIVRHDVYVNTWSRYEARFSKPQERASSGGNGASDGGSGRNSSRITISNFVNRRSGV